MGRLSSAQELSREGSRVSSLAVWGFSVQSCCGYARMAEEGTHFHLAFLFLHFTKGQSQTRPWTPPKPNPDWAHVPRAWTSGRTSQGRRHWRGRSPRRSSAGAGAAALWGREGQHGGEQQRTPWGSGYRCISSPFLLPHWACTHPGRAGPALMAVPGQLPRTELHLLGSSPPLGKAASGSGQTSRFPTQLG